MVLVCDPVMVADAAKFITNYSYVKVRLLLVGL